ncbi:hypothetical protein FQN50_002973 [Emmonsiellopsis sp. PD_5]|nr:hypothetical protein FQN50_002973 [Emmonsiellopsis sp. PD_5]
MSGKPKGNRLPKNRRPAAGGGNAAGDIPSGPQSPTRPTRRVFGRDDDSDPLVGGMRGLSLTAGAGGVVIGDIYSSLCIPSLRCLHHGMRTELTVSNHRGRQGGGVQVPDPTVTSIENAVERSIKELRTPGTVQKPELDRLPLRPEFGTQGNKVILYANYLGLGMKEGLSLYRYSVEVLPDSDRKTPAGGGQQRTGPVGMKLKRIIELLIDQVFGKHRDEIATDYKATLISSVDIEVNDTDKMVIYSTEDEAVSQTVKLFKVRVRLTRRLEVGDLLDHLSSTNGSDMFLAKEEVIQALNIVIGHYPKTKMDICNIGANNHFLLDKNDVEKTSLRGGLESLRGFFISVRAATAQMLINVQVKHTACYREGSLIDVINQWLSHNNQNMPKLSSFLKGLRVSTTHLKNVKMRPRRILGLAAPDDGMSLDRKPSVQKCGACAGGVKFWLDDSWRSRYISVAEYFKEIHGIVCNPTLPVVNVGSKERPSYLPADVCVVLPGQPATLNLGSSQTQDMIRFTVRRPGVNAAFIHTKGPKILGSAAQDSSLAAFGLTVKPGLITVPGRVLTGPPIRYKANKTIIPAHGSWNMQQIQFTSSNRLTQWSYLWIKPAPQSQPQTSFATEKDLLSHMRSFAQKLQKAGIPVTEPMNGQTMQLTGIHSRDEAEVEDKIRRFATNPSAPKFILVILPYSTSLYDHIKYLCDVKWGIHSVCVIGSKFMRQDEKYSSNVALKFNLKLGGINQTIDRSKLGVIAEGKTMVVGIDVTHPSPGSSANAPSVAAIVASIDENLAQWPADIRIQTARQEMVSGLDELLKSRLSLWAARHKGAYPENILVYRDGVSEGQYQVVLDQELPLLQKGCRDIYPAAMTKEGKPKMSIIIVGKRHNTRFFPSQPHEADRSKNPKNGTVVDRGVTDVHNWDFFLQSHTAIQGTARPAHYYVIYDQIFRNRRAAGQNVADNVESLTHNLCYLFGRATKSVSICPAASYADLVCTRARRYLSKFFGDGVTTAESAVSGDGVVGSASPEDVRVHKNLKDSMFYI